MVRHRKERLTQLLVKYRNNTLSSSEYEEFLLLIGEDGAQEVINAVAETDWREEGGFVEEVTEELERKSYKVFHWALTMAASVLAVLSFYHFRPVDPAKPEYVSFQTTFGETRSVVLPDSSTVLLNANSSLSWNANWKEAGIREVNLVGEAFFDVKKIKGVQFLVESGEVKVKVLGTVFNVRNRGGATDVFLESGKVSLEIDAVSKKKLAMVPGNTVHYNRKNRDLVLKKSSTLDKSASWVAGMLEFENESLVDILSHFEELYGKKFQINNKALLQKRMDLSLPYADWELIRKAIEISLKVEFEEKNNVVIVN